MNIKTASHAWNLSSWMVMGAVILIALGAFEVFNFDTTRYGLETLLNGGSFYGVSWATILAIAACFVDLPGLARLVTEQKGKDEPIEIYVLGAGWLAATLINAALTWWSILSLMTVNPILGNELFPRTLLIKWVPPILASFVWLTRLAIIGAVSFAGDNFLHSGKIASNLAWQKKTQNTHTPPKGLPPIRRPQPEKLGDDLLRVLGASPDHSNGNGG
jgi:hypothetical protein